MSDVNGRRIEEQAEPNTGAEIEAVPTTAADVASAGRSCLAIVALAVVILVLLLIWIVVRSTGGG